VKLRNSKELMEQTRLKKDAAKMEEERERLIVRECQELMDKQEAARASALKQMADDQARRMALNSDVQKEKQARDDEMDARIERHWHEKYEADDAKFKKECSERQRRIQECEAQRKEHLDNNLRLMKLEHEKEQRYIAQLVAENEVALAKDREEAVEKREKRKEHQREVHAQRAESRARVAVDMTQTEWDFNRAAMVSATGKQS
jgi:hypothetical protein